jgi:Tfp pilus assembly protein PilF
MSIIENFEKMLAAGQDNALLRYSLGNAYLQQGDAARAVEHLALAVAQDPDYSAAWKAYAKALAEAGRGDAAVDAYETGIEVAERKGDKQAAKEMRVFHKRLLKQRSQ